MRVGEALGGSTPSGSILTRGAIYLIRNNVKFKDGVQVQEESDRNAA